jgi:hypothetical protein
MIALSLIVYLRMSETSEIVIERRNRLFQQRK